MTCCHLAAALSITTLYKSSLTTSKQAYSAGYQACLADVLQFVQAGVSIQGQGSNVGAEGLTIGKIMDWIEGRLEATRGAEEDDDDDKAAHTQGKPRAPPRRPDTTNISHNAARSRATPEIKPTAIREDIRTRAESESEQGGSHQQRHLYHSSPSPPRSPSPIITKPPFRKERLQRQSHPLPSPTSITDFPLITPTHEPDSPLTLSPINVSVDFPATMGIGSKRRHGTLFDGGSGPSSSRAVSTQLPNGNRRRTRGNRPSLTSASNATPALFGGTVAPGFEPMEIEEREERARKVPRR